MSSIAFLAPARAQSFNPPASSPPLGTTPPVSYSGNSTSYLPYNGAAGGFVPYSPGPSGGLGVQPRMAPMPAPRPALPMSGMAETSASSFGRAPSAFPSLPPLRALSPGMRSTMPTTIPSMSRMPRRPVGYYPFRQPPSLISPAGSTSPGMSM